MGLLWRTLIRGIFKTVGLDSPYSAKEYGVNWSKQKQRCLERDDYTCQVCEKHQSGMSRDPAVHHITPRSHFDETPMEMNHLDNLVTLCHSCHGKLEGKYTGGDVDEFVEKAQSENI